MAREVTLRQLLGGVLRKQRKALIASACYGVWLFSILFNNMFFEGGSVLIAISAYGWGIVISLALLGVAQLVSSRSQKPLSPKALVIASLATALGFCAVEAACFAHLIDSGLGAALAIIAAATSLTAGMAAAFALLAPLSLEERLGMLILGLTAAGLLFLGTLLAPFRVFRLVLIATILIVGLGASATESGYDSRNRQEDYRFDARSRRGLILLLAGGGFLCSYELNTMQKTTHFVQDIFGQAAIGGTAAASLLAVTLLIVLLCLILRELRRPQRAIAAIAFALILMAIYYCLPIMENQTFPISFILILALGSSFLVGALLLFLEGRRRKDWLVEKSLSPIGAWGIVQAGALGGATLAYWIMESFSAGSPVGKILSFLPSLTIFAILGCFLFYWKDLRSLTQEAPDLASPPLRDLDTSRMEDRCQFFSQQFKLTRRESEVLRLVSQGRNIPGIAEALTVSQATAKSHLLHIYKKASVSSRQELIDLLYANEGDR